MRTPHITIRSHIQDFLISATGHDEKTVTEKLRSSDRFSEMVEEMAAHYHNGDYKNVCLSELEATSAEEAQDLGLSDAVAPGGRRPGERETDWTSSASAAQFPPSGHRGPGPRGGA